MSTLPKYIVSFFAYLFDKLYVFKFLKISRILVVLFQHLPFVNVTKSIIIRITSLAVLELIIMFDFVVVDDNKDILKIVKNILEVFCFQKNIKANIYTYTKYSKYFYKIFESPNIRIFILDIEVNGTSGIDIARQIRSHSTEDIIIFLSAYEDKYKDHIFKMTLRYFCFINKNELDSLNPRLDELFNQFKIDNNVLEFKERGQYYKIKKSAILYIKNIARSNKSIIYTDFYEFEISSTVGKLFKNLGDDFFMLGKSFLINKKHCVGYNFSEKQLIFDNGLILEIIPSRMREKELIKLLD